MHRGEAGGAHRLSAQGHSAGCRLPYTMALDWTLTISTCLRINDWWKLDALRMVGICRNGTIGCRTQCLYWLGFVARALLYS
jgi:hypothetical protein